MKKIAKHLIVSIAVLMLFSCSDSFLDRQPLDQVVSSNFYQTEQDAKQALVSIYDVLGYQSTPGISWAPVIMISDILSDDSFAGGADANDGLGQDQMDKYNIPTTNQIVHSIWKKNYTGIYRANLYLEIIGGIDASEEFKTRTIAEAKFLRAYFYFEQVRFFENIPLLTATISGPSEYSQTQNTPEEVYNLIASDLTEAIADLPEITSSVERGRISKWAAEALLARAFLFYNDVYGQDMMANNEVVDRAKALEYIEDLIANSGHDLIDDYNMLFRLASEFSVESVFEIQHGDSPAWWDWGYVRGGEGNLNSQMQGPRVTGSDNWDRGWSFGTVSEKLARDLEGDPRIDATILFEEELDGTLVKGYQHTGYFSQKYSSDAEHWGSDGQFELNRTTNQRVIRFADVLLMAAELGSPNAQMYLDRVRQRVDLPSIAATDENIFNERRFELSLEGHRYFDVLRKGRADQEFTVTGVRGDNYDQDQIVYDHSYNSSTRGFLPIPQTEIDLSNGVLVQNDGY